MKKIKFIFSYFIFLALLNSCGSLSDAGKVLRNEKTRTTDEFLVKKRQPLSFPPDYRNLPEPESKIKTKKNENDSITDILNIPEEKLDTKRKYSTVEQSIIDRINK